MSSQYAVTDTSDESEPETRGSDQPIVRIRRIHNNNNQEPNNNNANATTPDTNNNGQAVPGTLTEPGQAALEVGNDFGFESFPPVASFLVVFQLFLYLSSERFGIKSEEDIFISWEKVVTERQWWRLFVAHFYHSGRCHVFLNLITLLAMGRYLEKKIKPWPMLILIEIMGIVSNVFYMFISTYACSHPAHISTYGFSHIHYGLRILLAHTQDPRNYEPNLFLGLYPVYLSIAWAPWQPLLETSILKLVAEEINICGNIAGILTGFFTAFTIYCLPFHWSLKNQNTISNPFSYFMKANIVRFTNIAFALKMVQIFSKDACNNKGPSLVFGFYPVYLPTWLAPWEPFIENVFCDMIFKDHCIARNIAGIAAGLTFPLIDKFFHDVIVVPSKTSLCSTPSATTQREQCEVETHSENETVVLLNQISLANSCCDSESRTCASPGVEGSEVNLSNASSSAHFEETATAPTCRLKTSSSYNQIFPRRVSQNQHVYYLDLAPDFQGHSHFE